MPQFRKRPVVIDAMRYPGVGLDTVDEMIDFEKWFGRIGKGHRGRYVGQNLLIFTLEDGPNGEAKHVASPGDWVIRGVQGEMYPCKPDIFEATYEAVE